jgi:DUF218 domain
VITSIQVVVASRSTPTLGEIHPADAVVVIGSPTGSGALSSDLRLRCEEAVSLYRAGRAHVVITTGASSSSGAPTEASAAASCLRSHGVLHVTEVPASQIPTQLASVRRLLPSGGADRVILVADPLQTKWLEDVAAAESLEAQVAAVPAPKGGFFADVGTVWGQTVAVGLGRVVGYKSTGWIGG